MTDRELMLFALGPGRPLGERIADRIGVTLARHEEREFGGGEHKTRPLAEVGGRDVFVLQDLHGDSEASCNDRLVRLLFFIGALKDAGAGRVTAVAPYLPYSRKDRRTKPRDPVSTRYVAALFEAVGTDQIVTLEVHNVSAFENAFRACRPEHVPTARLMAEHVGAALAEADVAVVSPDSGGDKRAELFRHELERRLGRPVSKAIMEKHRSRDMITGSLFAGDVADRTAVVVDDLISSGGTLVRAAGACRDGGATHVVAVATHAMFPADAPLFAPSGPDRIIVTDSLPLPAGLPESARAKVDVIGVADLLGEVVRGLHDGRPVSDVIPYD